MRKALLGLVVFLIVVAAALGFQNHSKRSYVRQEAVRLTGGNPERGRHLVGYYSLRPAGGASAMEVGRCGVHAVATAQPERSDEGGL